MPDEHWERVGVHTFYGPMTLSRQLVQVAAHDGYHDRQLIDALR